MAKLIIKFGLRLKSNVGMLGQDVTCLLSAKCLYNLMLCASCEEYLMDGPMRKDVQGQVYLVTEHVMIEFAASVKVLCLLASLLLINTLWLLRLISQTILLAIYRVHCSSSRFYRVSSSCFFIYFANIRSQV